jgi:hypothetical protein
MGQGDPGSQHQTGVTLALADVPNVSFGESDLAQGRIWVINGLMRCNKNVRVVPFASSQS